MNFSFKLHNQFRIFQKLQFNRRFSSNILHVSQGGTFSIDCSKVKRSVILIEAKWQDHSELKFSENFKVIQHDKDNNNNKCDIVAHSDIDEAELTLQIPEICNLTIKANELTLIMKNKVRKFNL